MSSRIVSRVGDSLIDFFRRFRTGEHARFLRFAIVGGSGVLVNEGFAYLGNYVFFLGISPAGLRAQTAVLLGIVISIFTNFVLNDLWTWGDRAKRGRRHWYTRLGLYYLFASVAAVIQFVVFNLTHHWVLELHFMLANFIGIGCGVLINYHVNNRFTFRDK